MLTIQEGHQLTVISISNLIILGIFMKCQKCILLTENHHLQKSINSKVEILLKCDRKNNLKTNIIRRVNFVPERSGILPWDFFFYCDLSLRFYLVFPHLIFTRQRITFKNKV